MLINLDCDGVLNRWYDAAAKYLGLGDTYTGKDYWMHKHYGMPIEEFRKGLNRREFWMGVPLHEDAHRYIQLMRQTGHRWRILTAPMTPESYGWKAEWFFSHFPDLYDKLTVTHDKSFDAHEGSILIDDCDDNVLRFRSHKGYGIFVPRPWNLQRNLTDISFDFVGNNCGRVCSFYQHPW